MSKLVEIFKAWGIMLNPNDSQHELAVSRLEICDKCDKKRLKPIVHCSECVCALNAKIYTVGIGGCPLGKWISVEMEWNRKKNNERYNQLK
jgi:hypothetical protein